MAKNFGKAGIAKKIKEVEKLSAEKAQVITLQMINTKKLIDYPRNGEDIEDTLDIENSIKEIGFTDPIEVTGFGMDEGKFMIVSGHRRRAAGVKTGMEIFPCIVRNFSNDEEVRNYVLLSNSQRDSAKDPLLFVKRYKMHEEYLKESGFSGSIREEVAKRLGISVQQADRYKQFNKIILPVWDLVRNEEVGMSSVLPMSSHAPEEQAEIYNIIVECMSSMGEDEKPNRKTVKMIIDKYREGARSWNEIVEMTSQRVDDIPHGEDLGNGNSEEKPLDGQTTIDDFDVLDENDESIYEDCEVHGIEEEIKDSDYEPSPYEDDSVPAFDIAPQEEYDVNALKKDFIKNFEGLKKVLKKLNKHPELKELHVRDCTLEVAVKNSISSYFADIQELIMMLEEIKEN